MLRQLFFGGVLSLTNIAIHALGMASVVAASRAASARRVAHPVLRLVVIMIAIVSVLMAFHLAEIGVWSVGYALLDVTPPGADWRLLGPMTAMNGVLLFGWSTAVIFEVLRRAVQLSD